MSDESSGRLIVISGSCLSRGLVFGEDGKVDEDGFGAADLGCQPGGQSGFHNADAMVGQLEVGVSAVRSLLVRIFFGDFKLQHSVLIASTSEDESPPDDSPFPGSSLVTFRKYSVRIERHGYD